MGPPEGTCWSYSMRYNSRGPKKILTNRTFQNSGKVCIRGSSNCSYWNLAIDVAGYCWIDFNMQQHSTSRTDIVIVFATRWLGSKFQFQEPLVLETKRELRILTEESQVCELNQFALFLRTWIKSSPGIESVHENITLGSKHNEWWINKSVSQQWCSNAREWWSKIWG